MAYHAKLAKIDWAKARIIVIDSECRPEIARFVLELYESHSVWINYTWFPNLGSATSIAPTPCSYVYVDKNAHAENDYIDSAYYIEAVTTLLQEILDFQVCKCDPTDLFNYGCCCNSASKR